MQDLRQDSKEIKKGFRVPRFNLLLFLISNRTILKRMVIIIAVLILLFFPAQIANVISNWVNNFIGTLIHNIKI